jgi:hypothetical protein
VGQLIKEEIEPWEGKRESQVITFAPRKFPGRLGRSPNCVHERKTSLPIYID